MSKRTESTKYYIYSLRHPDRKMIRYIGKTNRPDRREYEHKYKLGKSKKDKWILSILNKGKKPVLEILEECNEGNWHKREIYFIRKFQRAGYNLLNDSKGVKKRTNSEKRNSIKNALLEGTYFKLSSDNRRIQLTVVTEEFGSLNLYGNTFYDMYNGEISNIKKAYYFIFIDGERYSVPKGCIIYKVLAKDIPEVGSPVGLRNVDQ